MSYVIITVGTLGHCAVYTGLHDLASFKGNYLSYDPCSSIFVMYVRKDNFILIRILFLSVLI